MESRGPCTYVTRDWNVHDIRWVTALADLGFEVTTLSFLRDSLTEDTLRETLTHTEGPILAGPLDSVTQSLISTATSTSDPYHQHSVIGLSWGFDLIDMHQRGDDLTWLTELSGLLVDSPETTRIAESAGVEPDRITFIPWGVDLDTFTPHGPAKTAEDFDLPAGTRLIITLRAHEPRYRNSDIIEAFATIAQRDSTCALLLGHSGTHTPKLRNLVEERGLADRVRFLGTLDEAALPPLLRAAAVYVTASEVDGASVTLLQAMACGAPVVASDTEGNRAWVLPGETGRIFQTGDPTSLAEAITEALDPTRTEETRQMATEGCTLVEKDADWAINRTRLLTALAPRH